VAEGVRFELTRPFGLPVFKTGAINRSATPPERLCALIFALAKRWARWIEQSSLGGPWSREGGLLDAKNSKTTRQVFTFR
jgi:hypothetical protein